MPKRKAEVELSPPEPKRQLRSSKSPVKREITLSSSPKKKTTSAPLPKPRGRPPSASPKKDKARAKMPEEVEECDSSEDELDCIDEREDTTTRRRSPRKQPPQPKAGRSSPKPNTRASPKKVTKSNIPSTSDTQDILPRRSARNSPKKPETLELPQTPKPDRRRGSLGPELRYTPGSGKKTYGRARGRARTTRASPSPSPAESSESSREPSPVASLRQSKYSTAASTPKHSHSPSPPPKTSPPHPDSEEDSTAGLDGADELLDVPSSDEELVDEDEEIPTSDPFADDLLVSDEPRVVDQTPEYDEPVHDCMDSDEDDNTSQSSRLSSLSPTPPLRVETASRSYSRTDISSSSSMLSACLNAQKRAILSALSSSGNQELTTKESKGNADAYATLSALINGSIERGETNSCLVIGARNSGKTQLVETCIANCKEKPIVIRLSGWAQSDEKQALKEIAWQLTQQTGRSFLEEDDAEDEESPERTVNDDAFLVDEDDDEPNPFLSTSQPTSSSSSYPILPTSLPPAHRISSLISTLPSLPRPTIVILDALDLFALHTRQALLYCLFDMVQTSRPGGGRKGVAVVGFTTRVEVVTLFEKRVKSRFSGRVVLLGEVEKADDDEEGKGKKKKKGREMERWERRTRSILCPKDVRVSLEDWRPLQSSADDDDDDDVDVESVDMDQWRVKWDDVVARFLEQRDVREQLELTCELVDDISLLGRILIGPVLQLDATLKLSPKALKAAVQTQRSRNLDGVVAALPYPALGLLIAFTHLRTAGHDTATFEMLFRSFSDQANASGAAPVQLRQGSIGLMKCPRGVLVAAFQSLISMRVLLPVASQGTNAANVGREFVKYRCALELGTVKRAVEAKGNPSLNNWLSKNGRA